MRMLSHTSLRSGCRTVQPVLPCRAGRASSRLSSKTVSPVKCMGTAHANVSKIAPFKLERWFAKYEFTAPYLLCCSDCEALSLQETLALADAECAGLWESLSLGYTESAGLPALRQAVTNLYTTLDPSQVLVCTPEEGIYLAMLALLQPGDHVVVTDPGYQSLHEVARSIGCEVNFWQPRPTDQGLHFNVDDLESLVREDTKLLVINFPHNPTGALPSVDEFQRMIGVAEARGAFVFSDEMYRGLELSEGTTLPSAADLYSRALVLCGMSKVWSLPGLRIGWLAGQAEALGRIAELKDYTTICSSAPSEVLALIGLRARDHIQQQNLRLMRANLDLLDTFFERHSDKFKWSRPAASSIAFPELVTGESSEAFCNRLVEDTGILLLPSSAYDYHPSDGRQHFRVGFGRKNIPQILEKLDDHLSSS